MGTGRDRTGPSETPSRPVLWTRSPVGAGTLALLVVGCRLDGKEAGGIKLLYASYKHFFYVQYNRPSYQLLVQITIDATIIFLRSLIPLLNLRLAQPVFRKNNRGRSGIKLSEYGVRKAEADGLKMTV